MSRNRKIFDRWSALKDSRQSNYDGWQQQKNNSNSQRPSAYPAPNSQDAQPVANTSNQQQPPTFNTEKSVNQQYPANGQPKEPPEKLQQLRKPLPSNWRFWGILIVVLSGSLGLMSIAVLLKLPAVPNCPRLFLPTASASMRLYCGQVAANKQTMEDLLEAISLVTKLPEDHPLRPEIDRNIEQWSLDLLKIGEKEFQGGKLSEAVKIAKKIPAGVAAYKLVEDRIDHWQAIWSTAESHYQKSEQALRNTKWNDAFKEAVRLTYIGNEYWATVKYEELIQNIQKARKESERLDKAFRLSRSGSIDNIIEAIKQAEQIPPSSYAYKEAQDLINKSGEKLLNMAKQWLDEGNWQGVLDITNALPKSVKMPELKSDLFDLANAVSRAEGGTAADLEDAIATVEKLDTERPLYDKGQKLISRWKREIGDVTRLERADNYANSGLANDLRLAIAEIQQIPQGNPRYQEARSKINTWRNKVERIEDQPYLDEAMQFAGFGGVQSLQEAIREASRIAPGRALYSEAQGKIRQWRGEIQRLQDKPFLDNADAYAASGNLPAAVTAAKKVRQGIPLYSEAQRKISTWQTELIGKQRLQEAYGAAKPGSPQALATAIRLARQVPGSSTSRGDARIAVNRWSRQILGMANRQSSSNLKQAVAIAKMVPSGTEAYQSAQSQIQTWQKILAPPPPPPPPAPAPAPAPAPVRPRVQPTPPPVAPSPRVQPAPPITSSPAPKREPEVVNQEPAQQSEVPETLELEEPETNTETESTEEETEEE